ncbi:hypothetical protein Tco_0792526 [Tanacetum coccineum]
MNSSDSVITDTPPSPTHGTPFNETTLSTQRSLVASDALRRRVMVLAPGQPIPHGMDIARITRKEPKTGQKRTRDGMSTQGVVYHSSVNKSHPWSNLVNSYLRVLQIGTRAKVIENQYHVFCDICCHLHFCLHRLSPGKSFWEADDVEDPRPGQCLRQDEREPMFVQAHDPDYMPEPIYPEYIPLEDEHEFPAEEQPLPPIDSPTAESPGYVTESDPEEDPKEYEDDETEDGPVDYPMDGGDDGDDDDDDSSKDDANDEDEDEEDEEDGEEEEHLAPADSTTVIHTDEPIFPPEGTEPVIPPPSTDITIRARITVRPQTSISLLPEAEVERLSDQTTSITITPISLSPPLQDPAEAVLEIAPMTVGEDSRSRYYSESTETAAGRFTYGRIGWTLQETVRMAHQTQLQLQSTLIQTQHQVHETRFQMQQAELAALRETDRRRQDQMVETLRVIRDMRREMSDMQTELLALREPQRRARQPGPEARSPDHRDASGDADSHI